MGLLQQRSVQFWVILALPVIRMVKRSWWETGLVVALLCSALMGSNLLMQTDMPTGLQFAHLIEVSGKAFVFSSIAVGLLRGRHPSRRTSQASTSKATGTLPAHASK